MTGNDKRTFFVIVAEDDLDDQEMTKTALKSLPVKIEVSSVYNGLQLMDYLLRREGYKNIQDKAPDLILLDLNMPFVDGFEILRQINNHPLLWEIPVYVLSTSRAEDDKKKALQLGARGFYTKPVSLTELKKIIDTVCSECLVA